MMEQAFNQLCALINDNVSSVWACCSAVWEYIESQPAENQEEIFNIFLNEIDLYDFKFSAPPSVDFEEKSGFRDAKEIEHKYVYEPRRKLKKLHVDMEPEHHPKGSAGYSIASNFKLSSESIRNKYFPVAFSIRQHMLQLVVCQPPHSLRCYLSGTG